MKHVFSFLTIILACACLTACSGHQPSGFYGSPFIVKKQPVEKKEEPTAQNEQK